MSVLVSPRPYDPSILSGPDTQRPKLSLTTSDELLQPWRQKARQNSPLSRFMGAPEAEQDKAAARGEVKKVNDFVPGPKVLDEFPASDTDPSYPMVMDPVKIESPIPTRLVGVNSMAELASSPENVDFNLDIFKEYEDSEEEDSSSESARSPETPPSLPQSPSPRESPIDSRPDSLSSLPYAGSIEVSSYNSSKRASTEDSASNYRISASTDVSSSSSINKELPLISPPFSPSAFMNPRTPPAPPPKDNMSRLAPPPGARKVRDLTRWSQHPASLDILLDAYGDDGEEKEEVVERSPSPSLSPPVKINITSPISAVAEERPAVPARDSVESMIVSSDGSLNESPLPSPPPSTSTSGSAMAVPSPKGLGNKLRELASTAPLVMPTPAAAPSSSPKRSPLTKDTPLPPLPPNNDVAISSAPSRKDSMLRGIPRTPSGIRRKGSGQATDPHSSVARYARSGSVTAVSEGKVVEQERVELPRDRQGERRGSGESDGRGSTKSERSPPILKHTSPTRQETQSPVFTGGLPPRPTRNRSIQWADEEVKDTTSPLASSPPKKSSPTRDNITSPTSAAVKELIQQMQLDKVFDPLTPRPAQFASSPKFVFPPASTNSSSPISPQVTSPTQKRSQATPFPTTPVRAGSVRTVQAKPIPKRRPSLYHPDME